MKAMILAAGRGERMRPLTDHTPKPLLQVGGQSLIVWHLQRLAAAGFTEVVINHAYLGEQIVDALGNGDRWGVSIQYSAEGVALETAGGMAYALPLLGDAPFLLVNGDIYTELDFAGLFGELEPGILAHLVMVDNPPQHAAGDFYLANQRLVEHGTEKLTYAGVGIYQPRMLAHLVAGQPAKLAPLLRDAIAHEQISAEHYHGVWHDIGTPQRLQALDQALSIRPHDAAD